jgi:hypothetical protein
MKVGPLIFKNVNGFVVCCGIVGFFIRGYFFT